tara:strand:+ start:1087 stop:1857 length:771 start_codon:yes stop_codon:yes gene_type:complete
MAAIPAIAFDGVDQRVTNTTVVDYNSDYTLAFTCSDPQGVQNYGSRALAFLGTAASGHPDQIGVQQQGTGPNFRINMTTATPGRYVNAYTGWVVVSPGPWFVVMRRDGDDLKCRIYHGSTFSEATATSISLGDRSAQGTAAIGSYYNNTAHPEANFTGVKVWSRYLSDAELNIEKLFLRAQSRENIEGEWPLLGGTEGLVDISGRGNDWTAVNSPTDGTETFNIAYAPQPLIIVEEASAPAPVTVALVNLPLNLYN